MTDHFSWSHFSPSYPSSPVLSCLFLCISPGMLRKESVSLFNYTSQRPFSSFQHPEFTPSFSAGPGAGMNLSSLFAGNQTMMAAAKKLCGESMACLLDYAATGDQDLANRTRADQLSTESDRHQLSESSRQLIASSLST